ncbi:MAG: AbrB/MazE/SpoVT family DNA-binding domain-containing protein [Deltaproteobacteria bacterium]|nr:AbrB/MazE/SpoVT family DNA-binding domain-containing protein [Deltaproteobacteria bacterium]
MPSAIISSKGQVTIPKAIRKALKVDVGDRLDFYLTSEKRVIVSAGTNDITKLKGILHQSDRQPVSIEEMNVAIARHK